MYIYIYNVYVYILSVCLRVIYFSCRFLTYLIY